MSRFFTSVASSSFASPPANTMLTQLICVIGTIASLLTCDENKRRHLLLSLFHQSHHSCTMENSCYCRARSCYHLSSIHIKLHVQLLLARSLRVLVTVGHIWCFLQKNTELCPVHDFYMSWNGMTDEFIKRVPTPDSPEDIHELAG